MSEILDVADGWHFRPEIASAEFPRTGWGHRGYDEAAVDTFVQRTGDELAAAQDQIQDLRLEVDRLHRYIRRQWAAVAAAESPDVAGAELNTASPAAQARAVLTQAQEIADRRLADARNRLGEADRLAGERLAQADQRAADLLSQAGDLVTRRIGEADAAAAQRLDRADAIANEVLRDAQQDATKRRAAAQGDAKRLLAVARSCYEDIVIRAHRRADHAAELALHEYEEAATETGDAGRARAELEIKAAYLRTFAKVSRTALQAALDISGRDFDRLLGASAAAEPARTITSLGADREVEALADRGDDPATDRFAAALPVLQSQVLILPGDELVEVARVSP